MSDSNTFDEAGALSVIQEMVKQSRYRLSKSAVFFVIWGVAIITACLLHYIFIQLQILEGVYVWPVFIGIGVLGSLITGRKQAAEEAQARSYIDRINAYLWIGSAAPFAILIGIGSVFGWAAAYPAFIAFLGWAGLVTGGLLRFKPLILGGMLSWGIAVITLFVRGPEILLLMAAALLVGFLVPALMMWRADSAGAADTRP